MVSDRQGQSLEFSHNNTAERLKLIQDFRHQYGAFSGKLLPILVNGQVFTLCKDCEIGNQAVFSAVTQGM